MPNDMYYTEDTFAATYDLTLEDARRMIGAVGTAKADLDIFILAYRNRAAMEELVLNLREHAVKQRS